MVYPPLRMIQCIINVDTLYNKLGQDRGKAALCFLRRAALAHNPVLYHSSRLAELQRPSERRSPITALVFDIDKGKTISYIHEDDHLFQRSDCFASRI